MEKVIITSRGRNTSNIIEDYRRLTGDVSPVNIIARDNDNLAQEGDISSAELRELLDSLNRGTEIIVIANGGTTQQIFGIIDATISNRRPALFIEVGRDEIIELYKLQTIMVDVCGGGCSGGYDKEMIY